MGVVSAFLEARARLRGTDQNGLGMRGWPEEATLLGKTLALPWRRALLGKEEGGGADPGGHGGARRRWSGGMRAVSSIPSSREWRPSVPDPPSVVAHAEPLRSLETPPSAPSTSGRQRPAPGEHRRGLVRPIGRGARRRGHALCRAGAPPGSTWRTIGKSVWCRSDRGRRVHPDAGSVATGAGDRALFLSWKKSSSLRFDCSRSLWGTRTRYQFFGSRWALRLLSARRHG